MPEPERETVIGGAGSIEARGDEMGGAPYPSDMTMPDPRAGDRGGDFEGETDPVVRGDKGDERDGTAPGQRAEPEN